MGVPYERANSPFSSNRWQHGFFGSNDHYLYAVDLETGSEKWKFKNGSRVASSPAVAQGLVQPLRHPVNRRLPVNQPTSPRFPDCPTHREPGILSAHG